MRGERGFTLIEALIAFAILAVVLVALYEVMGTSLKGFDRAAETDEALMIAQSQLDRLTATKTPPTEPLQGAIDGTPFRWHATITPSAQQEPEHLRASPLRLHTLRLVVTWRQREVAVQKAVLLQRAPSG
jgi:type II secretion system protein I